MQATHQCQYLLVLYATTELSTPFVNARWLLKERRLQHGTAYVANGLVMAATFASVRVVWVPLTMVRIAWAMTWAEIAALPYYVPLLVVLLFPPITLLNAYWCACIFSGIVHHFRPS